MGLKGNLSTVNLADVFQVLSRGNSTGLLRIQAPEGPRFVEIQNGAISIAGRSAGRILLGDLLLSRGLLDEQKLEAALQTQRESGKLLGQVLLDQQIVALQSLEEALRFQIEEEVCELFTLGKGDFDFLAGAMLDAKIAPGGGLVKLKIDPNSLLLEAARRADEWKAIEQRIPSQAFMFRLTVQGGELLTSGTGLSPEGLVLLRLVQDSRSVEAMVQKACMGRLNTNQMLLELWDAGIIEPLPIDNYEKAARSHLRLHRVDEAQRIAEFAATTGGAEMKAKCQAALAEIEKAKKASISGSMTATGGDPRIRSEVIRRNQPGLILKKERNPLPLIAGVILVVALGAGAAAYFTLYSTKKVDTTQRKLLDEQLDQAQNAMNAQNYAKALELLRAFHSKDPDTQALAAQKYEAERQNVEVLLAKAITDFNTAYSKGPPEALKSASVELEKFTGLTSLSDAALQEFAKARSLLAQVKSREKLDATRTRLRELDNTAKSKTADALKQGYEGLLADNPPEEIAAEVRDKLSKLVRARSEAENRLRLALREKEAGESENAKALFDLVRRDGPGTDYAAKGSAGVEDVDSGLAEYQKRLDKVDILQTQKLADEAKAELKKIIDSRPPERIFNAAYDALRQIENTPETELEKQFKEAKDLADRQPADARKKFLALLEKAPYSSTALGVTLKVNVKSEPSNADLFLNGRPAGKTPAVVDVPALGAAHFTFKKAGFRSEEIVEYNFRDEKLEVALSKEPVLVRSMPAPAVGGLIVNADYGIVLTANEANLCAPADLKVLSRVVLRAKDDQKPDTALSGASMLWSQGYIFADLTDKGIARLRIPSGEYTRFALSATATSSPLAYVSKELPGRHLLGVASESALEILDMDDGKTHKCVGPGQQAGSGKLPPPPWGLALNGELFYIPREAAFTAILGHSGVKKWEAPVEGKILAGPVFASGRNTLGVVAQTGRLLGFDADTGAKRFERALAGKPAPYIASTANAFVTVTADGKAELNSADKGGVLWAVELKGAPVLAPVVMRASDKDPEKAFVFCTQVKDGGALTVVGSDGVLLWRARLFSRPIAATAFGDKIFVATADGEVSGFDLN